MAQDDGFLDPNDPRFQPQGAPVNQGTDQELQQAKQFAQQWMNERGIPSSWGTVDDYAQRYQSLRAQGLSFDDARQGAINQLGWDKGPAGQQTANATGGGGNTSWWDPKDPKGSIARLLQGKPPTGATLLSLKPQFDAVGIQISPANAEGVVSKINVPGIGWTRVLDGGEKSDQSGTGTGWTFVQQGDGGGGGSGGGGGNYNLAMPGDLTQGFTQQFSFGQAPQFQPFTQQFNAPDTPQLTPWTKEFQAPANAPTYDKFTEAFTVDPFTEQFHAPTAEEARQTPGYQFTLDTGLEGIDRGAASKGTLLTMGNQMARSQYATGLADQTYNDVYARAQNEYQNRLNLYQQNLGNAFNAYQSRFNVNQANNQGAQNAYQNQFANALNTYNTGFLGNQYNNSQLQQNYQNQYQNALQNYNAAFNTASYNNQGAQSAYQQSYNNAMQEYLNAFNIYNTNQNNLFNRYYSLANLGLSGAGGQAGADLAGGQAANQSATNIGNARGAGSILGGNTNANIYNAGLTTAGALF